MRESQYWKRTDGRVHVISISMWTKVSEHFVRVWSHENTYSGEDSYIREAEKVYPFPLMDLAIAHIRAFTSGLLEDGYQPVKPPGGTS